MIKKQLIFSPQEIEKRLRELELGRGQRPKEGEGLTINTIKQFLGYNNYRIYMAAHGCMSQETQLQLSQLFQQWDAGEIVFTYRKGDGWRVHRPQFPTPRKSGLHRQEIKVNLQTGDLEYKIGD